MASTTTILELDAVRNGVFPLWQNLSGVKGRVIAATGMDKSPSVHNLSLPMENYNRVRAFYRL